MTYILKDHPSCVWKIDLRTNNKIKKNSQGMFLRGIAMEGVRNGQIQDVFLCISLDVRYGKKNEKSRKTLRTLV